MRLQRLGLFTISQSEEGLGAGRGCLGGLSGEELERGFGDGLGAGRALTIGEDV